jgi:tetratricopeptide (TPR) repeat protein
MKPTFFRSNTTFLLRPRSRAAGWIRRVVLIAVSGLFILYVGGAFAGYMFLRHVRKNDQVTVLDVALLRWRDVRRSMAAQQFERAQAEWDAGKFQAAFVAFTFAVANDPDNTKGRLNAARFLQSAGALPMALTMLESGLARDPNHEALIERTFELLLATGRDERVLELLRQRSAGDLPAPLALRLRKYELQARLNRGDLDGARKLLVAHPELARSHDSRRAVAQLQWESKERLRAIELLNRQVEEQPDDKESVAQLFQWQLVAGMTADAVRTAELASKRAPGDAGARVQLLEALALQTNRGKEWLGAVEAFMREFGSRPEAVRQLGTLAGRRGWVDLARRLYELSATRESDLTGAALAYCDALIRVNRYREAGEALDQIEAQTLEGGLAFIVQLRTRQIFVAAGKGDRNAVSDLSRRLSAAVRNDSGTRELLRRTFQKAGVAEAAELLGAATASTVAVRK